MCLSAILLLGDTQLVTQEPTLLTTGANRERLEALMTAFRDGREYVPGEVLVQFRSGVPQSLQTSVLRVLRADMQASALHWIGDTLLVSGLTDDDPERAAEVLERQPEVLFAQPNYIRQLHSIPNDTSYSSQWHLDVIRMPQAWDINNGAAAGVTVAVLDSGLTNVQGTFGFRIWTGLSFGVFGVPFVPVPDFDRSRVRNGVEFTPTGPWITSGGQQVVWDAVGHGTHVAGTVAQQTNNSFGYAGIANGATLLPIKVCVGNWDLQLSFGSLGIPGRVPANASGCADADVAAGIRYAADNGAKVINLSLGGTPAMPAVQQALQYAVQRGVFVAISAGNSAAEGNPTNYPAAYAAQLDGVVAVGAVTRNRERAFYSSFGPYVELTAPGGALNAGPINDVWQVHPEETDLDITRWVTPSFTRYVGKAIAGTSMASPHVAGVAALLYSQGITNPAAIENALKQFAVDLGPTGRDDQYGSGLIDARASLRGMGVAR
jgi:serine protease